MEVKEVTENTEKRKFPRVNTHIPVRYRKLGDPETETRSSTITKNLSVGGIRFSAPEFISRACRLILELDIPMINKPVKAISKVAWIKKGEAGENYEVGNQFLEISKKDKALVSEYVSSLTLYNDSPA
ncbi:PilZ domain-containing protein [Candidatus Omnitrophota bacterium]